MNTTTAAASQNRDQARLSAKIPQSIKDEAVAASSSDKCCWSQVCINFDDDFAEYFISPFFVPEWDEENQLTVARVQHGQVILLS